MIKRYKDEDIEFNTIHNYQTSPNINIDDKEIVGLFSLSKRFDKSPEFYEKTLYD
jgi:glutaredoxin